MKQILNFLGCFGVNNRTWLVVERTHHRVFMYYAFVIYRYHNQA